MLKNLLLLSGFSTFAVIMIVGLNIYHNYSLSSLPNTTQIHVVPITPTFDKKTLDNLKKRTTVESTIEGQSGIISEDSKSTIASPTQSVPVASISATPTVAVPLPQILQ